MWRHITNSDASPHYVYINDIISVRYTATKHPGNPDG